MAGYPPPPFSAPPPAGPPFGFDPRDQQRAYREQARAYARMQRDSVKAQREAFRAQRDLLRQQTRVPRRMSVLGPLLLVTFGVLALLVSIGRLPLPSLLDWYSRWWPLAIVAAGVLLLAEWGFDQWSTQRAAAEGAPLPITRRGLGAGTVFLIVLLVLCGISAQGFREGVQTLSGTEFGITRNNFDELFGEKYQRQQELDQPFAPGTSLQVENPHGDVTITGQSGDGRIHITVNKQIYSASAGQVDARAQLLAPQIAMNGSTLSVTLPSVSGGVSDLSITLPDSAAVTVNATHGDLHLSNLRAPVNVTASRGDIELNGIAAPVIAYMSNRNSSLQAHNLGAELQLKGRADDLSITDVAGEVSLEGEFFGDTHLAHLRGPMLFQTNRTHFSLARLDGEVDISPDSALSGSDILGPTELRTRSRNISLENVAGAVDVINTNGSVDLHSGLPLGSISVDNRNGDVNLSIPEHAGVAVDAETQGGTIENNLNLTPETDHDNSRLHGQMGDGVNRISIHTTHDNINIRQQPVSTPPLARTVGVAPGGTQAPATPAATPGGKPASKPHKHKTAAVPAPTV